jgi:hypothetical protein
MKTVSTRLRTLALAATIAALVVGLPAPAMAGFQPTPSRGDTTQSAPLASTAWPRPYYRFDDQPIVNGTYTYQCFGREGVIKGDSKVLIVDWNKDGRDDECFGIAPNRAIYHAWPSSVGWDPMPNNGLADDTWFPFFYQNKYHTVSVSVAGKGFYCSSLIGSWQPWGPCTPT